MAETTVTMPEGVLDEVRRKALAEGVRVDDVLLKLLTRWVHDELTLDANSDPKQTGEITERALSSFGMWRDRDPDQLLEESRASLRQRDGELQRARLSSR